jgi:hypothetical protein
LVSVTVATPAVKFPAANVPVVPVSVTPVPAQMICAAVPDPFWVKVSPLGFVYVVTTL